MSPDNTSPLPLHLQNDFRVSKNFVPWEGFTPAVISQVKEYRRDDEPDRKRLQLIFDVRRDDVQAHVQIKRIIPLSGVSLKGQPYINKLLDVWASAGLNDQVSCLVDQTAEQIEALTRWHLLGKTVYLDLRTEMYHNTFFTTADTAVTAHQYNLRRTTRTDRRPVPFDNVVAKYGYKVPSGRLPSQPALSNSSKVMDPDEVDQLEARVYATVGGDAELVKALEEPPAPFRLLAFNEYAQDGDEEFHTGQLDWFVVDDDDASSKPVGSERAVRRPIRIESPGFRYLDAEERIDPVTDEYKAGKGDINDRMAFTWSKDWTASTPVGSNAEDMPAWVDDAIRRPYDVYNLHQRILLRIGLEVRASRIDAPDTTLTVMVDIMHPDEVC